MEQKKNNNEQSEKQQNSEKRAFNKMSLLAEAMRETFLYIHFFCLELQIQQKAENLSLPLRLIFSQMTILTTPVLEHYYLFPIRCITLSLKV